MQQLREKAGLLEAVQRPGVSGSGLKTFLCFFWNSSGVLPDRLLGMILMETPQANYHKLIQVANKMLFSLRQDIEKCWRRCFQDIARKHTAIKEKLLFYIEFFDFRHTRPFFKII